MDLVASGKQWLKKNCPALIRMVRSRRSAFTRIYRDNRWNSGESVSGPGSTLEATARVREVLPKLLSELGVKTMLDAPCGDFHWMRHVNLGDVCYIGMDIVPDLVARDQKSFADDRHEFRNGDLVRDKLPAVDLIFCRDCLVHLPAQDVLLALKNFKRSGAGWLLTTTFPNHQDNPDIIAGNWRPINLQHRPFDLPAPHKLINENCNEGGGKFADKSMGLWKLSELPV